MRGFGEGMQGWLGKVDLRHGLHLHTRSALYFPSLCSTLIMSPVTPIAVTVAPALRAWSVLFLHITGIVHSPRAHDCQRIASIILSIKADHVDAPLQRCNRMIL